MIHQPEYVKKLLKKYMERTASPSETETLLTALDLFDEDEIVQMLDEINPEISYKKYSNRDWETPPFRELKERINKTTASKIGSKHQMFYSNVAVYIAIAGLACILFWFISQPSKLQYSCGGISDDAESPTGVYSCRLLLSNGCSVLIDSTYKGLVEKQGNTEIVKLESGVLLYKKRPSLKGSDTAKWMYNTITTSKGAQYRIVLPDGSKVRINAASSIRFPVEFSKSERLVEVDGEAFFDVADNTKAFFIVKVKNAEIKVLATRFNINTYSNHTVTTLTKGSLIIKSGSDSVSLKPGEQAIVKDGQDGLDMTGSILNVSQADTTQIVSWKKMKRIYTDVALKDFVMDVGRSYDLEMIHMGCVPNRLISVTLCYDIRPEEVMKLFREMGLHFKQEGRNIIFCKQDNGYKPGKTASL